MSVARTSLVHRKSSCAETVLRWDGLLTLGLNRTWLARSRLPNTVTECRSYWRELGLVAAALEEASRSRVLDGCSMKRCIGESDISTPHHPMARPRKFSGGVCVAFAARCRCVRRWDYMPLGLVRLLSFVG